MRVLPLILALSLTAIGCGDDSPTGPSPFPATVTLQPGQQSNVGGLIILFDQVVTDSRCPADAMCIDAGDATISINLSLGGVGSRYELSVVDPTRRSVIFEDHQVELATLAPYPQSTQPISPSAYRATLTVTKP